MPNDYGTVWPFQKATTSQHGGIKKSTVLVLLIASLAIGSIAVANPLTCRLLLRKCQKLLTKRVPAGSNKYGDFQATAPLYNKNDPSP